MDKEAKLDETIEESFPASDPPANTVVTGVAAQPEKDVPSGMEIKHRFDDPKGIFYIEQDGKRVAEMTYVMSAPTIMIIDHTGVSPELKGQQVGRKLVLAGVEHARAKQLKIVPLCPFAKVEFEKHRQEYADVLYQLSKS
jgi:predicted GNAT family acetyltransferase